MNKSAEYSRTRRLPKAAIAMFGPIPFTWEWIISSVRTFMDLAQLGGSYYDYYNLSETAWGPTLVFL